MALISFACSKALSVRAAYKPGCGGVELDQAEVRIDVLRIQCDRFF